jgi:uncharacterized protein (DUF1697 family)
MHAFAALLRGVNVGGRNRVPMPALATALGELGHEDVVTYIQSGNVAFRSPRKDARLVAREIEGRIADGFGLDVTVLLRTHAELKKIAAANPFPGAEAEPARLHVVFLDGAPARSAVAALDPNRSPGDEFAVRGREIYLRLPDGAGRSKLGLDWFERGLGARGTQRNWNTLLKLIELTGG